MEESALYNLLSSKLLIKWWKEAEKDEIPFCVEREQDAKEELLKNLPEKNKDTLRVYASAIREQLDYLHAHLHLKILNLGVQLGMELQKGFISDED